MRNAHVRHSYGYGDLFLWKFTSGGRAVVAYSLNAAFV